MADSESKSARIIVVGVDGSDTSVSALRWACRYAVQSDSSVEAVTAWEWPTSLGPAVAIPEDYDPATDADTVLHQTVDPLSREFPSVTIRPRAVEGHPAQTLVEASRHADLLVVGNRGHGELSGLLIGSVSQYCVAHAESPVLVYREARA